MKSRIVNLDYQEGALLTEGEVAAEMGLSRTPVREAFLRLEAEDLLQLLPKKGALVRPIALSEVREVMELRTLIEKHSIAALLAGDRGPTLAALDKYLKEQAEAARDQDVDRFIEVDRDFHHSIVQAANNRLLTGIYEDLRDRQLRMGIKAVTASSQRLKHVLSEHKAIVGAIRAGNLNRCLEAIQMHLELTASSLHVAPPVPGIAGTGPESRTPGRRGDSPFSVIPGRAARRYAGGGGLR